MPRNNKSITALLAIFYFVARQVLGHYFYNLGTSGFLASRIAWYFVFDFVLFLTFLVVFRWLHGGKVGLYANAVIDFTAFLILLHLHSLLRMPQILPHLAAMGLGWLPFALFLSTALWLIATLLRTAKLAQALRGQ